MKLKLVRLAALLVVAVGVLGAGRAEACAVRGKVVCTGTGAPVEGVTVTVVAHKGGVTWTKTTGADGGFEFTVYGWESYDIVADATALGGTVTSAQFSTTDLLVQTLPDLAVDVPGCVTTVYGCWLTAGGAKFSSVTGTAVAEHGPTVNFGGNVNPSCSPDPGQGGQWNHVDHARKLHFQGLAIRVDACGNIQGIPPGSTSPITPYNYIDFSGTGVLKGIKGNRFATKEVCFVARAEDRNEPGSSGQRDGAGKDKYFLHVFDCSTNVTELVFEATPGAKDTETITDGNLQMHTTSCD